MHLRLYCEQRSAAAGTERFEAEIILSAISYKYLTEKEEREGDEERGRCVEEDRQGWRAVFWKPSDNWAREISSKLKVRPGGGFAGSFWSRNRLRCLFLALEPVSQICSTALPLNSVVLITSSYCCMETQVVPQINTIKPSGQLLYLYSPPITLLIKGNNSQNTFQVVWTCMCVGGELEEGLRRGSFYSCIQLRQIFLNSFHITYRLFLFLAPTRGPNTHTKVEDYRKSGKTKLITPGISTSQRWLKCNYTGLELRLRLALAANLPLEEMFPAQKPGRRRKWRRKHGWKYILCHLDEGASRMQSKFFFKIKQR